MSVPRRAILLLSALATFAVSCAQTPRKATLPPDPDYDAIATQPKPSTWRPGALWVFVELDEQGAIRRSRTVRVTDTASSNNMDSGDQWRALAWGTNTPSDRLPEFPVYAVDGRNLVIEWANQNHDSEAYVGALGAEGFVGRVRTAYYTYMKGPPQWHPDMGTRVLGVPVGDLRADSAALAYTPTSESMGAMLSASRWATNCPRSQADLSGLQAEPTPYGWAVPARWAFIEYGEGGAIRSVRSVRLTDEKIAACGFDDWKRMTALDGPATAGTSPSAYRVQGRTAMLLFDPERCATVTGELDAGGFHHRGGTARTACGLEAGSIHGIPNGP